MKPWMIAHHGHIQAAEKACAAISDYADFIPVCESAPLPAFNAIELTVDPAVDGLRISVGECCGDSQHILLTGRDETHLLYAVSDFRNLYLPQARNAGEHQPVYYLRDLFNVPFPPYEHVSRARIARRGIWLWGYTLYDYRRFIDNMASLKLNTLILWNDVLPGNIRQVIDYAHQNGVQLFLGFAWGWDPHMPPRITDELCERVFHQVVRTYEEQYAGLNCDGVYFQTFTEGMPEVLEGTPVIDAAVALVNRIGRHLMDGHPSLKLLFGLHAGCALSRLNSLKALDDRISILWEDAGAFPYAYVPEKTEGFEETLRLTEKLCALRPGFGAVLKGVTALNWNTFEHQRGSFMLGAQGQRFLRRRTAEKQEILRQLQAAWLKNAHYARDVIRRMPEDAVVTCLAEDGMFEEKVNLPVALYAAMLWDGDKPMEQLLYETAMRTDVDFV